MLFFFFFFRSHIICNCNAFMFRWNKWWRSISDLPNKKREKRLVKYKWSGFFCVLPSYFDTLTWFCQQDTNKRIALPRDLRNLRPLELVSSALIWGNFSIQLFFEFFKSTGIWKVYFYEQRKKKKKLKPFRCKLIINLWSNSCIS